MPRKSAAGSGTIRKVTKTVNGKKYIYYEARYTVGTNAGTGKQEQKSIYAKTQKEVAQKLKEITLAIDSGTHTDPSAITLAKWLDIWLETYCVSIKESTKEKYGRDINNHIKPGIGAVRLKDLDTETIQRFYNGLELSDKSKRNIHGTLHRALDKARRLKKIAYNPSDDTELKRPEKHEITPLENSEFVRYVKAAEKDALGNMLILLAFTGMRRNELIGLPWDAVDFSEGSVTVKQQMSFYKGGYKIVPTKSSNIRKIYPAPIAMDALKRQKVWQDAMKEELEDIFEHEFNLVFTRETGSHISMHMLWEHNDKVQKAAGIQHHRIHDLRDTFAVNTLQAGDDIKTVQESLGHADAAFTLNVYIKSLETMRKKSASNMQALYEQASDADKGKNKGKTDC